METSFHYSHSSWKGQYIQYMRIEYATQWPPRVSSASKVNDRKIMIQDTFHNSIGDSRLASHR